MSTDAPSVPPQAVESAEPDARRMIALVVGILATVLFVILRFVVAIDDHKPLGIDVWWNELMVSIETPPGLILAWIPAIVGGTIGMFAIALLTVIVLYWRKRRWDSLNMAIAIALVVAIGAPMAAIIARARPGDSLAESVATSFPSGHTAVATTFVVTLALLFRRWWIWTIGAVWVVWMMWGRTYLHAHWLSDVVAGMLEGIAVATLVWCAVEALRDRRARKKLGAAPA
ncbi:phosphatase PAP2 family protein [Microbacterium sp. NPDC064584]|uniref:phosphatase PAP2 family protein n=1 Tax=Microbacterium sp. NPDC064584 TaxID=3155817 RepID=UPI003434DB2F